MTFFHWSYLLQIPRKAVQETFQRLRSHLNTTNGSWDIHDNIFWRYLAPVTLTFDLGDPTCIHVQTISTHTHKTILHSARTNKPKLFPCRTWIFTAWCASTLRITSGEAWPRSVCVFAATRQLSTSSTFSRRNSGLIWKCWRPATPCTKSTPRRVSVGYGRGLTPSCGLWSNKDILMIVVLVKGKFLQLVKRHWNELKWMLKIHWKMPKLLVSACWIWKILL